MIKKEELLKKIKKLSLEGVEGEKEAAEIMLKKLLDKFDISETSLDEDPETWCCYDYDMDIPDLSKKLLYQILASSFGREIRGTKVIKHDDCIAFYLKQSQAIELMAKYEFYIARLKEKLELAYVAFLDVNDLVRIVSASEVSAENIAKLDKAQKFVRAMDKDYYHKAIGTKKE